MVFSYMANFNHTLLFFWQLPWCLAFPETTKGKEEAVMGGETKYIIFRVIPFGIRIRSSSINILCTLEKESIYSFSKWKYLPNCLKGFFMTSKWGNIYTFYENISFIYLFRERGRKEEREGKKPASAASLQPQLGTWPSTQAHALTGNRTRGLFVPRTLPTNEPHQSRWYLCLFRRLWLLRST